MKTLSEFKTEIETEIEKRPSYIRYGQAVFNYIDEHYGVAREAQFIHNVDCFYRDELVDDFILTCYHILKDIED